MDSDFFLSSGVLFISVPCFGSAILQYCCVVTYIPDTISSKSDAMLPNSKFSYALVWSCPFSKFLSFVTSDFRASI